MNDTTPCGICQTPTTYLGTGLCDNCWEIEHRLSDLLRTAHGRAFVRGALAGAESQARKATR